MKSTSFLVASLASVGQKLKWKKMLVLSCADDFVDIKNSFVTSKVKNIILYPTPKPTPKPTNKPTPTGTAGEKKCISLASHISNEWCRSTGCAPDYVDAGICAWVD